MWKEGRSIRKARYEPQCPRTVVQWIVDREVFWLNKCSVFLHFGSGPAAVARVRSARRTINQRSQKKSGILFIGLADLANRRTLQTSRSSARFRCPSALCVLLVSRTAAAQSRGCRSSLSERTSHRRTDPLCSQIMFDTKKRHHGIRRGPEPHCFGDTPVDSAR